MLHCDDTDCWSGLRSDQLNEPKQLLEGLAKVTPNSLSPEEIRSTLTKLITQSKMSDHGAGKRTNHPPRASQVRVDGSNVNIVGSHNVVTLVDGTPVTPEKPNFTDLGMDKEVNRLATFKLWPHSAPVSANALARAGFFFTGIEDRVQCFACLGLIKDWEHGDTAMGEHKKHFPRCPFVRDHNYRNVPLVEKSKSGASGSTSEEKRAEEKAAGLFKASRNETKKSSQGGKKGAGKQTKAGGFDESQRTCEGNPTRQPTIDSAESEMRLTFRSEYKRLLSFQTWPRTHPIEPRDLAKAGFYFLEKDDLVQCFACFGKIRDWEPQDNPEREHARHFPSCPFVMGLEVKNEPITPLQASNVVSMLYREPSGFAATLEQFSKQLEAALPQTAKVVSQWDQTPIPNRVLDKPKYPDFVGENARLATYAKGWPGVLGITPQQLARAGFFFTGEGDSTKCFYCGGGLKHWESTDEPWTEHAKWFPVCDWLLQQRGQTFVSYVVRNFPVDRSQLNQVKKAAPSGGSSAPAVNPAASKAPSSSTSSRDPPGDEAGVLYKKISATETSLDEAMNSRSAKHILEMGYDADLVREVIGNQLRTAGKEFQNVNDLLEAVWQAEEQREAGTWQREDGKEQKGRASTGVEKFTKEVPEKQVKHVERKRDDLSLLSEKLQSMSVGNNISGQGRTTGAAVDMEREVERLREQNLCKVCMDNDVNVVLMPCTHFVVCDVCARSLMSCPICRGTITTIVKVFKS